MDELSKTGEKQAEILRLEASNARMRAALENIIEQGKRYWFQPKGYEASYEFSIPESDFNQALNAIAQAKGQQHQCSRCGEWGVIVNACVSALEHIDTFTTRQSSESPEEAALWAQCASFARAAINEATS